MKDNEIIKALECCSAGKHCRDCPLRDEDNCLISVRENALNLINRQKAEIAVLSMKNANLKISCGDQKAEIERLLEEKTAQETIIAKSKNIQKYLMDLNIERTVRLSKVKSEAVREFAERLKEEVAHIPAWGSVAEKKIDNLVKEMVGDGDA